MKFDAPVLETPRLRLRMLEQEDFEEYAAIHQDFEVTRFTARTHFTRMDTWRHLAMVVGHWQLRGFGMWGVFEKETNRLAGRVGFYEPDGWPAFELGWTIGREFWGKGYATEAARRCLAYAFKELDREHVISLIDPENTRSISVAEKLGETLEGEVEVGGYRLLMYGIAHVSPSPRKRGEGPRSGGEGPSQGTPLIRPSATFSPRGGAKEERGR